jgi:hypothetical protein
MREARVRRDVVAGELAAGRNPADLLAAMTVRPKTRTFREWAESYLDSRVDVGERTRAVIRSHFKKLLPTFGEDDPARIMPADVQVDRQRRPRPCVGQTLRRDPSARARFCRHRAESSPRPPSEAPPGHRGRTRTSGGCRVPGHSRAGAATGCTTPRRHRTDGHAHTRRSRAHLGRCRCRGRAVFGSLVSGRRPAALAGFECPTG